MEAPEKSSKFISSERVSASRYKNRASKHRGRPGGVIARNTNLNLDASGTKPKFATGFHSGGITPVHFFLQPTIIPVSSKSSRIAATLSAKTKSLLHL